MQPPPVGTRGGVAQHDSGQQQTIKGANERGQEDRRPWFLVRSLHLLPLVATVPWGPDAKSDMLRHPERHTVHEFVGGHVPHQMAGWWTVQLPPKVVLHSHLQLCRAWHNAFVTLSEKLQMLGPGWQQGSGREKHVHGGQCRACLPHQPGSH